MSGAGHLAPTFHGRHSVAPAQAAAPQTRSADWATAQRSHVTMHLSSIGCQRWMLYMSSENTLDDVFPPWNQGSFDTPTAFSDRFQSTTVRRHVTCIPKPLSPTHIAPRCNCRL